MQRMKENEFSEEMEASQRKSRVNYNMSAFTKSISTPKECLSRLRFGQHPRRGPWSRTIGLLVLLSSMSFLHLSSSTEDVPVSPSAPSTSFSMSSSSSSSAFPMPNNVQTQSTMKAYFINGLASSIRKINSSALSSSSENAPFQLEFRTACPFGNLIYDEEFAIGINTDGNLTYSRKRLTDSQGKYKLYSDVADSQWHSLLFNGSSITFKDHQGNTDYPVHFPINVPAQPGLALNPLQFFDGFVGCIRVSFVGDGKHRGISEDGHIHPNTEPDHFQLGAIPPYQDCNDLTVDLRGRHPCPDIESFVLCSQCQSGARCEEVEQADSDSPKNQCNDTEHLHDLIQSDGGILMNEFSGISENESTDSSSTEGSGTVGSRTIHSLNGGVVNSVLSPATSAKPHVAAENLTTPTEVHSDPSGSVAVAAAAASSETASAPPCPCQHGGVCLSTTSSTEMGGSQVCSCEGTGHYGEHCEIENTFCRSAPCKHGICQPKGDSYQCYCLPGYAGENCTLNFDECLSHPCQNGATCIDEVNKFKCQCAPGFKGSTCHIEVDECESNPCLNDGICTDAVANYTCQCIPGFTGHSCEINIDECQSKPCQNNGQCTDLINTFSCNCTDTGFEGFFCDRDVDDCQIKDGSGSPCKNDGVCEDGFKKYKCICHSGYDGIDCQNDWDDCAVNPCHNNGTCLQRSNISLYNSPVSSGLPAIFHGDFNYSAAGGYECICQPGFDGNDCSINIDECASQPCFYGKCIDGINNYSCACHPGYTDPICKTEINECEVHNPTNMTIGSPCERGTCVDMLADFRCECPEGYGSKNCSVELTGCQNIKCFNGGTCTPSYVSNKHSFTCACVPGYAGKVCQLPTTLSFNGNGYAEILSDDENFRKRYAMSFRFRTTLTDVLIAVGQGSTYFMLTLAGGKLNLQSSLLNILKGISSGNNVSNSDWHQAWVSINETHIALGVNLEQTIHPIQTEPEQPVETGFNTTVLGGATPGLSSLTNLPFFVGCIQDIKINDKKIVPGEDAENVKLDQNLVKIGCTRQEQCQPSPCENGGNCTDLWQKYECRCPRPYLGARCEFEYTAATFGHENTTTSYVEIHIPAEVGRKFEKAFEISLFARTREPRGTLFLIKDDRRENGFFLEAFVEEDGQLGLLAKLDDSKEETYSVGGLAINDGEPHLISFIREKGLVRISVNGTEHFRKSLPLKPNQAFNPVVMYIGGVPLPQESTSGPTGLSGPSEQPSELEGSTSPPIPSQPPVELTRTQRSLPPGLNKMDPFKGVIQDVRISINSNEGPGSGSHHPQVSRYVVEFFPLTQVNASYLMGDSLGTVKFVGKVMRGVVSDDACRDDPCQNDGVCQVTWNDYQCLCTEEYDGKTCSHLLPCAIVRCPTGSECKNIQAGAGFECVSEVAFDGKGTVSPHYRLKTTTDLENLTFNDITFKYRSQRGGSILHISDGLEKSLKISLEQEFTQSGPVSYISVQVNGNKSLERIPGGLNGSWHSIKLSLDAENRNFLVNFDGINKKNSVGVNIAPDFIKSIVTSTTAELILGSFLRSGSSSTYRLENSQDNTQDHHMVHAESLHDDFYRGCLSDVLIGDYRLPFVAPTQLITINPENNSLVETTAPTAFYIDERGEGDAGGTFRSDIGCILCYDKECQNGGHCEDAKNTFDCACRQGYNGILCEKNIDECDGNQCTFGSTCVDGIANYTCKCLPGYTGWLCAEEINECESDPCLHDGICEDRIGSYLCTCRSDYTGDNCEKKKLATCGDNPCDNGGKCISVPRLADGTYFTCSCLAGFTGSTCSKMIDFCENVSCSNGGTCKNRRPGFGADCICAPGYAGPTCEKDIDECELINGVSPCHNGTCTDHINSFSCNCDGTGFRGETCDIDINECELPDFYNRCPPNSNCTNIPGFYECRCTDGLCGEHCNVTNPCIGFDCHNGGTCIALCELDPPLAECKCRSGWEGTNCTVEVPLGAEQSEGALNIAFIIIPILAIILLIAVIVGVVLVRMARKKRATRGVYSPSQQEYCNPRVELDLGHVMKPPPEERLI